MPFGYNNSDWATYKCPFGCKGVFRFSLKDKFAREYYANWVPKHAKWHEVNDPQKRLYTGSYVFYPYDMEVEKRQMKIPQEAVAEQKAKSGLDYLRVGEIGLKLSQTCEFTITGETESGGTESKPFYSVPVSFKHPVTKQETKAQYRLNKTTLRAFVPTLGDDTANWIGAKFTSFAQMVNNPSNGKQQLGLTVLVDSVKAPNK